MSDRTTEARIRRTLARRGWALEKSRRRDPQAVDFGLYRIMDPRTNTAKAGASQAAFEMTLDDVERYLKTLPTNTL